MINITCMMTEITKGMKSIGPKYIYKHNSKSLIEYQIHYIKKYKSKINLNLILGFGADKIKKQLEKQKNIKINYLYNSNYLNEESGGNFKIAIKNFNSKKESGMLIMNNGILANINWERYIKKSTLNKIFYTDETCRNFNLGFDNNGEYLFYDLPNTWLEIIYLNKKTVLELQENIPEAIYDNMFLFEIINLLKEKSHLNFEPIKLPHSKLFKFNSPKDSKYLAKFL